MKKLYFILILIFGLSLHSLSQKKLINTIIGQEVQINSKSKHYFPLELSNGNIVWLSYLKDKFLEFIYYDDELNIKKELHSISFNEENKNSNKLTILHVDFTSKDLLFVVFIQTFYSVFTF